MQNVLILKTECYLHSEQYLLELRIGHELRKLCWYWQGIIDQIFRLIHLVMVVGSRSVRHRNP